MNFFAYAPVSVNGDREIKKDTTGTNSINADYPFTYAAKATSGVVDASDCDDIVFAFTPHVATFGTDPSQSDYGKTVSGSTDIFDLTFYHALAQIRFCVSTDDDTYDPNIKLCYVKLGGVETSGSFSGLVSNGKCTFKMTSSLDPSDYFTWSAATTPAYAYYLQEFGTSGVSFASGTPAGWTLGSYGTSPDVHDLYICTGDTFFVIPQTLSNCAVEVGIKEGTGDVQIMKGHLPGTVSGSTDVSWEAGKYYTYKIKAGKEFSFELLSSEWIDGSPSGGLQF